MANSADFEASLRIKAGVEGTDNINKLAESIADAGIDVTHLTDESAKLAKQFGEIEQKQALINQFRELKKATSEANTEWQAAQAATAAYTSQIETARDSLEALEVAMRNQGEMSQEEARATQAEYNAMVREVRNLEQAQADQAARASQLSSQYDDLNSRLVATRSAMHDVGLSTTGLNDQQRALALEASKARDSLTDLTTEAENLNELAKAKVILGIDTDENALKQIEEITRAYETLRDSGTLSQEEMAQATKAHTERVAELEASLAETTPTLEDLATEFGKVTAAAGGLTYVANEAMKFETAMAGVKKMVDGTPEQMEQLSQKIQQMSIDLGLGSDAIADIVAQGGGLGVPIEKLGEFTDMAGKMSVAFGMTAEEAGDAAAKMANVFDIPIEQVGGLADSINVLGNTTAAKEPEIVDAMLRIGGNAKQFGLAGDEAAALAAAMISLGKTPEVAATAINALLTKLQTANVQSDDFKNTLANIGISADKMAADIANNPQKALSDFLTTLSTMDKQQRSVATFKLFGQDYVDDVNALVGGLSGYNKALDSVKDKSATAGAMQKEFEAKSAASAFAIDKAKQSLSVFAQTIGKELLPVITFGAKLVGGIANNINDFAETFPVLTNFAVIIASAQVAMVAFNSTMTLAGAIGLRSGAQIATGAATATTSLNVATTSATRLSAAMAATGGAIGGLGGAVKGLTGQAVALAGAFALSYTVGDMMYKNVPAVRAVGDEMGRVLAYLDAMVTDRTFDDVDKFFETSKESSNRLAEAEKRLALAKEQAADAADKQKEAEQQGADAKDKNTKKTKEQTTEYQNMVSQFNALEAETKRYEATLADMEAGGLKNTEAFKMLSEMVLKNKDSMAYLKAEVDKNGFGDLLKTDLDKASASFEALGLDAEEFATGIDSKTNAALTAFVDIAHLAEGDTRKLALAYNAAKDAAGDNQAAQADLNAKLNQVTEGNTQLAEAVKKTAQEQKEAKSASEEQAAALDKLGISMEAANAGMSKGGAEMVQTLKSGITAIKEQATSADALKTSLQQAFSQSIDSAKTKADFVAIKKSIDDAGVASNLTAEQLKLLNAGITGGAESAKKAKDEIDKETKALADNAAASENTAEAKKQVADANKKVGETALESAEKSKQAAEQQAQAVGSMTDVIASMMDNFTASISKGLQTVGITSEQSLAISRKAMTDMASGLTGTWDNFFQRFGDMQQRMNADIAQFNAMREGAIRMTQALGGASAGVNELAEAQHALRHAQDANIDGIIRMDNTTLDNLKRQIDSTRQKLDDLANSAKATADNLEADLARLKGDDGMAQKLEQTRKLTDLQEKLSEAQERGNSKEIEQLNRAIELQKQINVEQNKQAETKKQQEQQAQAQKQQQQAQAKPTPADTPKPAEQKPVSSPAQTAVSTSNITDPSIANSARLVADEIRRIKKEAIDEFMKTLQDELKRQAR